MKKNAESRDDMKVGSDRERQGKREKRNILENVYAAVLNFRFHLRVKSFVVF